jgi:hypothetical protein
MQAGLHPTYRLIPYVNLAESQKSILRKGEPDVRQVPDGIDDTF